MDGSLTVNTRDVTVTASDASKIYGQTVTFAVTGNTNATFGDWTARRVQGYAADVAFVTVPYERMHNLVAAIPHASVGTAEAVIPAAFKHEIDE